MAQDHPTVVGDRGDQEHLPGRSAGAVQQFPVDRGGGPQPGRCRVGHRPRGGAALLTLQRLVASSGDDRDRRVTAYYISGVSAGRRVEGVAVQAGQYPPERAFAGHCVSAPPRVEPSPETVQDILRRLRRPLPDRGHRVVTGHQRRARGQDQNHQ